MNIEKYFKGSDHLEDREENLFKLMNELDEESFNLFSEVIDMSDISYYKIKDVSYRLKKLIEIEGEVINSFNYINKIEESSYDYAAKRFQLKRVITAILTIYTSLSNFIFGIICFVLLNHTASKEFTKELTYINENIQRFDREKLLRINRTLANSNRIFYGKIDKMNEKIKNNKSLNLLLANDYLNAYIEGKITEEVINILPINVKNIMINILKQDLNTDDNDLISLLNSAKNYQIKSLNLIKKYEN